MRISGMKTSRDGRLHKPERLPRTPRKTPRPRTEDVRVAHTMPLAWRIHLVSLPIHYNILLGAWIGASAVAILVAY